jgi:hypothetical protein
MRKAARTQRKEAEKVAAQTLASEEAAKKQARKLAKRQRRQHTCAGIDATTVDAPAQGYLCIAIIMQENMMLRFVQQNTVYMLKTYHKLSTAPLLSVEKHCKLVQ